jgi:hypothetical protein
VTYFVPVWRESDSAALGWEHIMPRQSPYDIKLSKAERAELTVRARRYTSRYRDVIPAKIVLLASKGMANNTIAVRLDTAATDRQQVASAFLHSTLGWARRATAWRATGAFSPVCHGRNQGPGLACPPRIAAGALVAQ